MKASFSRNKRCGCM